jgi:hypothetical protein
VRRCMDLGRISRLVGVFSLLFACMFYVVLISGLYHNDLMNAALLDYWMNRSPGRPGLCSRSFTDIVFYIAYGTVEGMQERLKDAQNAYVRQWIVGSPRLPLLRDRRERDKEGKLRNAAYALRQYLRWVHRPKHRIALTRLMLSDHGLAVERLRRAERGRPPVPRERRNNIFCGTRTTVPRVPAAEAHSTNAGRLRIPGTGLIRLAYHVYRR